MSIIQELGKVLERFEAGYKTFTNKYLEIFSNPSMSEIREIIKAGKEAEGSEIDSVRFIAFLDKKKIYIWYVFGGMHAVIADRALGMKGFSVYDPNVFAGVADLEGGRLIVSSSYWNDENVRGKMSWTDFNKAISSDWSWLNKYVRVDQHMREIKNYFKPEMFDKP